jgi:hypothetical protein
MGCRLKLHFDGPLSRVAYFRLGSIATSGLRNLNDCSRSDPAFGARPQQHLVWLAACGLGAATELSWFGDGNRP